MEASVGDLLYAPDGWEWQALRASKLPDLVAPLATELAVDTHMSLLADGDFVRQQEAIDAASGPPLTPKADHDVAVLVTNLLQGNRRTPNYDGTASAVYSLPPLASAGMTEAAALAAGRRFRTSWQNTSARFNTRRVGETTSGFKVLIEEGAEHIIGAHLLGPHADEMINVFAAATRLRMPASELKQVLFTYPTYGSDIRFMA